MKVKTTGSVLIAALAAITVGFLLLCREAPAEAAYPIEQANMAAGRGIRARLRAIWRSNAVIRENGRLRREVASLALVGGYAERLEAENARLREALEYVKGARETWLAAEVLSEEGGAAGRDKTLRVNRGSLHGVSEGAVVTVPDGLVGRVTEVTPHTAVVTLITAESVGVSCEIEAAVSPKVRGVTAGKRGDTIVIRHLRNATEVPSRSRVLTSGLGGVFPKGLVIGTLQDVRKDANGLASEGEVLPSVDFESLEDVFIRREK